MFNIPEHLIVRDENGVVTGFRIRHEDGQDVTLQEVAEADPETFQRFAELVGDEDEDD